MKQAILLSIQPKWLLFILKLLKTIEIRKIFPKLINCDVYLYCTQKCDRETLRELIEILGYDPRGKVVAKFTLKRISEFDGNMIAHLYCGTRYVGDNKSFLEQMCLTTDEIEKYQGDPCNSLYAWHIENLVKFEEPMELKNFKYNCSKKCEYRGKSGTEVESGAIFNGPAICEKNEYEPKYCTKCKFKIITKAPQSFMYCWVGD